ncbi:DotA/TraY family protein [Pseudomonas serbica]|uniref:DotA/TraY family protein n=1 Tax=Pseudomonas serbica TaxID=2965074 RepID=UPI00237C48DE|nr:DotA/TraY family protein [Pseudomonas serbica]
MIKKMGALLGAVMLFLTLFASSPAHAADAVGAGTAEGYMTHIMSMPYDSTDLAHKSMVRLFGGFVFTPFGGAPSDAPTVLAKVLGYTNIVAMILGVIIMGYVILAGTLNTAASGEMLGRSWSSVWLPLRTSVAFGMIMPATTGDGTFSVAQSLVMWMIIVGSNSATWLWQKGAEELATGTPVMPTTVHYTSNEYTDIVNTVYCSAVRNKVLTTKDKQAPFVGEVESAVPGSGSLTRSVAFKYDGIAGLDLSKAISIKFTGCGQVDFPVAQGILDGTALENAAADSSFWHHSSPWEVALQTKFNQAVLTDYKAVLNASVAVANNIITNNLNAKNYKSAMEQGEEEAADMKVKIETAAVTYATVGTAYDNYIEGVRTKTTASGATSGWRESMTRGGWMRAGAWFFEASRLQGFVQTLLGGMSSMAKYSNTPTLEASGCMFTFGFGKCGEQEEEFKSWMSIIEVLAKSADSKSSGRTAITNGAGTGKVDIISNESGHGLFDENAVKTLSVSVSQTFLDGIMQMGADDARGLAGGDGAVTSSTATGMISPFTAVSSIGRGLQQVAVMVWSSGLIVATALGWMESPPGILANGGSFGWLGGLAGMAKYVMASLAPIIAGVGALAFVMAFAIPFMPVTVWIMLVCGYLVTIIEAVAAAPLAVIMLATPEGEGMSSGNFTKALQMVNAVVLRPTLSIVGLFAAMTLSYAGFSILNDLFWSVANLTSDFSIFEIMALIFIYASVTFKVCEYMVSVIHKIPDQIMDWMGGGLSRPFGEDSAASDVSGSLKQNAGASGLTAMAGMKTAGGIVQQRRDKARHKEMLKAMGGDKPKDEPAS